LPQPFHYPGKKSLIWQVVNIRTIVRTMKNCFLIISCLLLSAIGAAAQQTDAQLFTGTIDGKISITMFLYAEQRPCEQKMVYKGIYKYNKTQGNNKWLWLNIDYNEAERFVMVEERFSGVMILRKENNGFSGIWIHPDGVTQRKVVLTQQQLSKEALEKYTGQFDETNHLYHDC
jgi:hypothetical protein